MILIIILLTFVNAISEDTIFMYKYKKFEKHYPTEYNSYLGKTYKYLIDYKWSLYNYCSTSVDVEMSDLCEFIIETNSMSKSSLLSKFVCSNI